VPFTEENGVLLPTVRDGKKTKKQKTKTDLHSCSTHIRAILSLEGENVSSYL